MPDQSVTKQHNLAATMQHQWQTH